jgi:hypothetical protein
LITNITTERSARIAILVRRKKNIRLINCIRAKGKVYIKYNELCEYDCTDSAGMIAYLREKAFHKKIMKILTLIIGSNCKNQGIFV